jgi:hypothetical protein
MLSVTLHLDCTCDLLDSLFVEFICGVEVVLTGIDLNDGYEQKPDIGVPK